MGTACFRFCHKANEPERLVQVFSRRPELYVVLPCHLPGHIPSIFPRLGNDGGSNGWSPSPVKTTINFRGLKVSFLAQFTFIYMSLTNAAPATVRRPTPSQLGSPRSGGTRRDNPCSPSCYLEREKSLYACVDCRSNIMVLFMAGDDSLEIGWNSGRPARHRTPTV